MAKWEDAPFEEIVAAVDLHASKGCKCLQKFTCEHCGQRNGIDEPNVLYTRGTCEMCGHVTDIKKRGCNYALTASADVPGAQEHALEWIRSRGAL